MAEDPDIFIIMLQNCNTNADIFLRREPRLSRTEDIYIYIQSALPTLIRDYIICIQAWSVFDTTSAIYGHGKIHLMKLLLRTSFDAQTLSNTHTDTHSTIRYAKYNYGLIVAKLNRVEPQRFPHPN